MALNVSDTLPAAALTFGILFTVLLIIHIGQQIQCRADYWSILLACAFSAAAYYCKLVAYERNGEEEVTLGTWICFVVLAFMAPFCKSIILLLSVILSNNNMWSW